MATEKKGFVLYFDACRELEVLEPEQRGWLLTALYTFAMACAKGEGAEVQSLLDRFPQLGPEARMACRFLCETIQRDTRKWRERQAHYVQAAQKREDAKRSGEKCGEMARYVEQLHRDWGRGHEKNGPPNSEPFF